MIRRDLLQNSARFLCRFEPAICLRKSYRKITLLNIDFKDIPCPKDVILVLSRFDAAPLIAFTTTKEMTYETETDG